MTWRRSGRRREALNEAAQPLAQALYADAQAGAGTDRRDRERRGSSAIEDEVVEDADFEVIDDETATKA